MSTVARQYSEPACADLGRPQHLPALFASGPTPTLERWQQQIAPPLRRQFEQLLGEPAFGPGEYDPTALVLDRFDEDDDFQATLYRQPTGPHEAQRVLLLEPRGVTRWPRPAALAPFYIPDRVAGFDLQRRARRDDEPMIYFARHLAQQGYVVACPEAFPFNMTPQAGDSRDGFAIWRAAAAKLAHQHPRWTGMGKLTHDTRRALDLLLQQPNIDAQRVAVIGHSLGGKMSFYAGCLDERIKATIVSDFGIGWDFTNWSDPWYLGERIRRPGLTLAHHQLLALHAPRPFFLIAGEADRRESWAYLQAAQQVYRLYGCPERVACFDHASGHTPTLRSLALAYRWLAEQFGLPAVSWRP